MIFSRFHITVFPSDARQAAPYDLQPYVNSYPKWLTSLQTQARTGCVQYMDKL